MFFVMLNEKEQTGRFKQFLVLKLGVEFVIDIL